MKHVSKFTDFLETKADLDCMNPEEKLTVTVSLLARKVETD